MSLMQMRCWNWLEVTGAREVHVGLEQVYSCTSACSWLCVLDRLRLFFFTLQMQPQRPQPPLAAEGAGLSAQRLLVLPQ
jgi:hypothetical protein